MKSVSFPRRSLPACVTTSELDALARLDLGEVAMVGPSVPIGDIARMFIDQRMPAIAVVDDDDGLVGLVTRSDVLRRIDEPGVTAEALMSCYVFAVPADSTVECAAALMVMGSVGSLVVVNDRDDVIGVVTTLEIAREVARRAGYCAA